MKPIKFIHAADIHLDSPLIGLAAYDDAPADKLRTATRDAFKRLINAAIEQQVDFVIIAGDLYDGAWKDHNTGIFFCKEISRLKKDHIPVYLLFGNHDAESEMTKKLQLPDNVLVFDTREPSTFLLKELNIALHGRSFKEKENNDENFVINYPAPISGMFNIGVLHTALEGNNNHARYAPCSLELLDNKGYDYWALGHVHNHKVWQKKSTIVFSGNLQGRHIRETDERGAVLVTVNEHGEIALERLLVDVLRWRHLELDVSNCASFKQISDLIATKLEELIDTSEVIMPYAVRITLIGKTAAHGELFGLAMQLRQEVLAKIDLPNNDRLWLEKIVINTNALEDEQTITARADAVAILQNFLIEAATDAAFINDLKTDLFKLFKHAPSELINTTPYFQKIREGELSNLIHEVRQDLIAYIKK